MKDIPILFTGEDVRAILDGRKRVTRRVIKPQQTSPKIPPINMEPWLFDGRQETDDDGRLLWVGFHPEYPTGCKWFSCPYGKPGDRLWVRETWRDLVDIGRGHNFTAYKADGEIIHLYDPELSDKKWRPSIHMPRWASRLTLEVTASRPERVQQITADGAFDEGIRLATLPEETPEKFVVTYRDLWDSIYKKRGYPWESNPWVWVVEFKRVSR